MMNMLFSKVLGENENRRSFWPTKYKWEVIQFQKSLEWFEENQVSFTELNYNEVAHWHILLIGITVTNNSINLLFQTGESSLYSLR